MQNIPPSSPLCACCQFQVDLFLPDVQEMEKEAVAPHHDEALPLEDWVSEPRKAWTALRRCRFIDTHGHAHLERESQEHYHKDVECGQAGAIGMRNGQADGDSDELIISLSCAVEQADWETCLQYTSQSHKRIAALGIHPWYIGNMTDDWAMKLEELLKKHTRIMVGEIGLCKRARFIRTYEKGKQAAMELQRQVFVTQIHLAAKYRRLVSIHCVNQQQILLDTFKDMDQIPPAIALHSFTGTAHHVKQLLQWESNFLLRSKVSCSTDDNRNSSSSPPKPVLYFGFSHSVNYVMCSSEKSRQQGRIAIRAVPRDRILAESDVHATSDVVVGTAGAMAWIASALQENIASVAELTYWNGKAFLETNGMELNPNLENFL